MDSPSVRNILNQFDPRSPALAFQRTPLSFIINNPALLAEYNKTARSKQFNDSTASHELFDHDNSITNVEEHKNDLQYQTPVPEKIEKIGLLETNLDFVETDIDEARKIRRSMASSRVKNESLVENIDEKDPRSPSTEIDRTPIVLPVSREIEEKEEKTVSDELEEQVKELEKVNREIHLRNKNIINKNKDSVLIYEDSTETVVTPTIKLNSNIQNGEKTRTPLSCVMNTEKGLPKSRSNTPLSTYEKDSKSSAKSRSNTKSKIPVKIQNASSKKCEMRKTLLDKIPKNEQTFNHRIMNSENSPPIARKARWDHDQTVVL